MKPLLMRWLPIAIRTQFYYKFYRNKRSRFANLFDSAELAFAKGVKMRLSPHDEGHGCIAFTGFYELPLTRRVVNLAQKGGLFVDVGANYGYFSLLWGAQKKGNRVIAFEASPRNHDSIEANVSNSGFNEFIDIRRNAVGKESGIMNFSLGPSEQTGWGGIVLADNQKNSVEVPVVCLDDILKDDVFVDVLKIDIEGADTWALMGAERMLRDKKIGRIFYEENRPRMEELGIRVGETRNFLEDYGYSVSLLDGDSSLSVAEYEAFPLT
jgi:FkbM family methyltransferase